MKNFVQPGDVVTLIAPAGGVASGGGVLVGSLFGVAATTAVEAAEVEVKLDGVYDLPKAAGAIAAGAVVYFNTTTKLITTTAAGAVVVGAAVRAAGAGDATARVRLNGVSTA